ncbi:putative transmembrane protein (plasmid) [Rhizobium johnstonii 3841]|uniref:Transmembrane protein n=1 Tax=Rhizobium johnstonii (strain DSM 114642 / LMG 32736 / 3841) TaxID=216596 RepID=Q1M9W4_RHIJ3|nr:putative transmembrane protein [Rhizobium johnstonii 3841]
MRQAHSESSVRSATFGAANSLRMVNIGLSGKFATGPSRSCGGGRIYPDVNLRGRQGSTSRGQFSVYIRVLLMGYVLIIIILLSARVGRQCSGGLN